MIGKCSIYYYLSRFLRFFGSDTLYHATGDGHGVSKATVCRVVPKVCNAIIRTCLHAINFPQGEAINEVNEERFRAIAGMPEVIGE